MPSRLIERDDATLLINGHDWMKTLGLPLWTIAKMRDMRIGEELALFGFTGPAMSPKTGPTMAHATVIRHRGGYRLEVFWMLHVGNAKRRGHIWSWIDFVLEKGSTIRFVPERPGTPETTVAAIRASEKSVRLVCRLVARLREMAKKAGNRTSAFAMRPQLCAADRRTVNHATFLDTIAAVPLRSHMEAAAA